MEFFIIYAVLNVTLLISCAIYSATKNIYVKSEEESSAETGFIFTKVTMKLTQASILTAILIMIFD